MLKTEQNRAAYHPVSYFQLILLRASENPDTTLHFDKHMTIKWACRIGPRMPFRTLRRAFDKLVARHESLRLRLVQRAGGWQAEVLPEHPTGLQTVDLTHLSEPEQIEAALAHADTPMNAQSSPLFEMVLFNCGKGGDIVVTRLHHSIIDAYSMAIMIEELMKFVLNMPVLGKAPGHADFVSHRAALEAERDAEKLAYWRDHLLPLPATLNVGRVKQGLAPINPTCLGPTIRLSEILDPPRMQHLEALAKATGLSAFTLLHAAFSEALCAYGAGEEVLVSSVLGRQQGAMAGFVGADIYTMCLKYRAQPGQLIERAQWVSAQIRDGLHQMPSRAYRPGHAIAQAFENQGVAKDRFMVHVDTPSGRFAKSPFRKLFNHTFSQKISAGFLWLEPLPLPIECESSFELKFLIEPASGGTNAALIADASAYTTEDLHALAEIVCSVLDQAQN